VGQDNSRAECVDMNICVAPQIQRPWFPASVGLRAASFDAAYAPSPGVPMKAPIDGGC